MARPAGGYVNKAGERIVGTTTFVQVMGDCNPLMLWAYKRGREHQRQQDQGNENAPTRLYDEVEEAASIGTVAHDLVEEHIIKRHGKRQKKLPSADRVSRLYSVPLESAKAVLRSYQAFQDWYKQSQIEIVATEMPLVSENHQFGGTPDAIGRMPDGKLCLLDWKTSNGVYPEMLAQLAAYKLLIHECTSYRLDGGFHLLRFSKSHGDFTHHFYPELADAEKAALLCRGLYDLRKELTRRTK